MKVGIVGSRSLDVEIPENIISYDATDIFSGGADGMDKRAREYAENHNILITEILPEYDRYSRAAPLRRNDLIVELSDFVYIFWDGKSHGTLYVIKQCQKTDTPYALYYWQNKEFIKLTP